MQPSLCNKLVINFTPTGMIPTKEMTPHVPVTCEEIVAQVLEARRFGVSIAHVHARDEAGLPSYKKELYQRIIRGIRDVDGYDNDSLILTVSTSGRNWSEFEKRSECLDLRGDERPDMGSLTLSSLNFNNMASVNSPQMIQSLASKMKDNGIKPELEVFDNGMINYAKYLHHKGLIQPPFYFNLILGNIACAQPNILNLGVMLAELPDESVWCVGGIGDAQLKMNLNGMVNGGGVRVGIEDNIWLSPKRDRLAKNSDLLQRIKSMADAMGLEIATPAELRRVLRMEIAP